VFEKKNVSVHASLDKLQCVYLICRKDRGVEVADDLKGKSIGLPQGMIVEFYLGRFLELNGLKMQDLTLIDAVPITDRRRSE